MNGKFDQDEKFLFKEVWSLKPNQGSGEIQGIWREKMQDELD